MRDSSPTDAFTERRPTHAPRPTPPGEAGAAARSRADAVEEDGELRRLLLGVLVVGLLVTLAELALPLGAGAPTWPAVSLVLVVLGLVAAVVAWVSTSPFSIRLLRVAMVPLVTVGVLGLWLVHQAGILLLLNLYTPLHGLRPLVGPFAASIPAFAPAAVILLGLLGLLCTYRHPLLR